MTIFGKLAMAADLTAPDGTPYYYISKGIAANGQDYPSTSISFYWKGSVGKAKIMYKGIKCNDGGYNNSGSPGPEVTIKALRVNPLTGDSEAYGGALPGGQKKLGGNCDSGEYTNFYVDISGLPVDPRTGLRGIQVKVEATNKGRAWFELISDAESKSGVQYAKADYFGAQGNTQVSFSHDTAKVSASKEYDFQMQFGNICNADPHKGSITFYDMDSNGSKYQDGSVKFRIGIPQANNTVTWLDNDDVRILMGGAYSKSVKRQNSGSDNYFVITAGSGSLAWVTVNMQANERYIVRLYGVSYRNDVAVSVPTDEIYGKAVCHAWSMYGWTDISRTTAAPGDYVTFTHYVRNDGPTATDRDISVNTSIRRTAGAPAASGMQSLGATNLGTFAAPVDSRKVYTNTIQIPDDAVVGQQYCERVGYWAYSSVAPVNYPDNYAQGGEKCVTVADIYELSPKVTPAADKISLDQPAIFSYDVDNNRTRSNTTAWSIRSVVIQPGVTLPANYFDGFDGTARSCAGYYKSGAVVSNPSKITCSDVAAESGSSGSGTFPGTSIADQTISQSYPVGTRICRSLTVDSYSQDSSPNARTSTLKCSVVVVSPSVQAWGSDVRVGSGFTTSSDLDSRITSALTYVGGVYKGSWSEYGLIASANITNFSSASGLNAAAATANPLDWSKLTFANKTLGSLGNFASSQTLGQIPDVKGYFIKSSGHAGLTLKQRAASISLGSYEANTVYVVDGTVSITADIKNNSPKSGVSALSQMVIIANNIDIDPGVKQIDAWLIAIPAVNVDGTGIINTCVLPGSDQRLSTAVCNNPLKINGPLMADTVLPRRTSGEGKDPAEVYDLRGDAYIWARKVSEANGTYHTTYIRELPPRY